jgi:hypothetical protein
MKVEYMEGNPMRDDVIRLSFDISIHEHAMLKAACAETMIPMKDFLHDLVLKGIQELREMQLKKRSVKPISQSRNGKFKSKASFAECVKDEI